MQEIKDRTGYEDILDLLEKEYISEYANKDIDMGYMDDLEYDKAEWRDRYFNFEVDKWYK